MGRAVIINWELLRRYTQNNYCLCGVYYVPNSLLIILHLRTSLTLQQLYVYEKRFYYYPLLRIIEEVGA